MANWSKPNIFSHKIITTSGRSRKHVEPTWRTILSPSAIRMQVCINYDPSITKVHAT